jgi:hypothetical protein
MQQDTQLKTIIGNVNGVTAAGVFLLSNSVTFSRLSSVFKLRLNSSIDQTNTKRSIIAVIRSNAPILAASNAMPGVYLHQTARYGGASVLISEMIRDAWEGIVFQPGECLSVYTLADDLGCLFVYSLNVHYRDL